MPVRCTKIRANSQHQGDSLVSTTRYRINRRHLMAGGAATLVSIGPVSRAFAQGAPLKVGVLLPRSGAQAGIGQDCYRAVELAPGLLKDLGLPALQIMNGDTETNVDTARSQAEK